MLLENIKIKLNKIRAAVAHKMPTKCHIWWKLTFGSY